MANHGPITKNGIHPISKVRVIPKGTSGTAKASTPKAPQVAAAGAKAVPGGHQAQGKPSTPAIAPKQQAEVKTAGSTAEEQKGLGSKFYPKQLGLRGK